MKIKLFCKNIGVIILTNFLMGCAGSGAHGNAIAQKTHALEAQSTPRPSPKNYGHFGSQQQEYMYKILVADIARLRGDNALAAEYFFEVAKQTRDPRLAENAAQTAWEARKYNIAMAAARLWVTLAPDNPNARQILGRMLLRQKRTKEAVAHLDAMVDSLKDDPQRLLSVMEAMLEQPNRAKALELIEKVVAKRKNDPVMLWTYSRLLIRLNKLDQALEVLRTLLNRVPDHAEAVPLYALLLDKQDRRSQALQWMKKALHKHPEKQKWRLVYAQMLADAQQYEKSIKQFQRLLSADPKNGDTLYALGVLSLQTKQLSAAKGYFIKLINTKQRFNNASYYLGQIAQEGKDQENALSWYRQVKGGSNYLNAQVRIALILVEQGQIDKATEHLRTVPVSREEDRISLIQIEAELLIDQKRYQQAMEAYNRVLKLKQNNTDVLYMRALLAEKMGRMAQLEQDLRRVLLIEPKNVNALNALGYSLADHTDRYQEAYELIKQALALSPDDYYILDSMGWILYKMGKYTQAIAYLRKAQANQEDPEIAAHLGEVLWVTGDQRAARQVWEKAIETFPDDEKLRGVVDRFLPEKEQGEP